MRTADVIVVGLGTTGLAAALLAAEAKLSVICIEPNVHPNVLPRAASMDRWSRTILERLCGEIETQQLRTQLVTASGSLLFDLPASPDLAFFFQPQLEEALRKELSSRSNVQLMLGWSFTGAIENDDRVEVTAMHHQSSDETTTVRGRFVLGCDGASSSVRGAAGLSLQGTTFDESTWLVADCALPDHRDGRQMLQTFRFVCDPRRPGVDLPLPGGHVRFEWILAPEEDVPDEDTLRSWIQQRGVSRADAESLTFIRKARYQFHAREASGQWTSPGQRLIVAGDAAHLTPPMRGQGMSSGIHDVSNLVWKLAAVIHGDAPLSLIASYHAERRHRVVANTHIAVWLSRLIASRSRIVAAFRDAIMPRITLGPLRPLFARDVIIASNTLVQRLQGPLGSLPALAGTLLLPQCTGSWELLHQPDGMESIVLVRPDGHVFAAWALEDASVAEALWEEKRHLKFLAKPHISPTTTLYSLLFSILRWFTPELLLMGFPLLFVLLIAWWAALLGAA